MNQETVGLDWEYKALFQQLTEDLGRVPTLKDPEYWDLTEWHRKECEEIARNRKVVWEAPNESNIIEVSLASNGVPESLEGVPAVPNQDSEYWASEWRRWRETRTCRDCNAEFVKKPGRGRWPVRCEDCRKGTE